MNLYTERLALRDFVLSDWSALNAILTDPQVKRFMHFAAWDQEQRRDWLSQMIQETSDSLRVAYNRAITLLSDGHLIGWFGIGNTAFAEKGVRDFGYALARRFWRNGYMTEALQAVIEYEFTALGTRRIIAECDEQNPASARVMQKNGMRYQSVLHAVDHDGRQCVSLHYAIDRDEWRNART